MIELVAYDTETRATSPGCKAPPMACLTWQARGDERPSIVHGTDPRARALYEGWVRNPNVHLVGHFIAYDNAVAAAAWPDLIPEIFAAYEAGRMHDTMIREKLWDIALGRYRGFYNEHGEWVSISYDLGDVARRRAGIHLKKDGWRKRYGEFLDIPLEQWPARAEQLIARARADLALGIKDKDLEAIVAGTPLEVITYPLEDARATMAVTLAHEEVRAKCDPDPFFDERRQVMASWWLTLMCNWGVRTREEGVRMLEAQTDEMIAALEGDMIRAGFIRPDGSADTKKVKAHMLDVCGWAQHVEKDANGKKTFSYTKLRDDAVPRMRLTKGGDVSLDRDACKESEDALLIDFGDLAQQKAVRSKDVPMLAAGIYHPVHTRIDLANSGRITSSSPNLANLRRLPGIREAFVPRDGNVFIQADYPGLELHTLAQTCFDLFGYSTLGKMLNDGIDPHLVFAAKLLKIPYEEAKKNKKRKDVDDARQVGKVFNFGKPGGLGTNRRRDGSDPTLITFARKAYGVVMTIDEAKEYDREWREMLPEMRDFFDYNARLCDNPKKQAMLLQLRSKRIRGGCYFPAACNTWFQGLGADATKAAGFDLAKAGYVNRNSPLFGSRTVVYVYDEFILETRDDDNAHDAAIECSRIMRESANEWIPDCPFKDPDPEPLLMRIWSKEAEALFHPVTKRLVPWEPALAGVIKMGTAVNEFRKHFVPTLVSA